MTPGWQPARCFAFGLALGFTLLFTGCRQPDYFPLSEGSSWDLEFFRREINGGETTELRRRPGRIEVLGVNDDSALGRYYVVRISRESIPVYTLYFQKRGGAVRMYVPFAAEVPGYADWIMLLAPKPRPGKAWYGNDYHEQFFEVAAREPVTVPAGTIAGCLRLDVRTEEEAWPGSIWFGPGIGFVKWEYRETRRREGVRVERIESAELAGGSY